jgi:hypothetical protein
MELKIKRSDMEVQIGLLVAAAPKSVSRSLVADEQFRKTVGLDVTSTLTTPAGKVGSPEYVRALKEVLGGATQVTMRTAIGETVEAESSLGDHGTVMLKTSKGTMLQPFATLLATDATQRLDAFEKWRGFVMLPRERLNYWRARLENEPPSEHEFMALCNEGDATPEALHDRLQGTQRLTVTAMVPLVDSYWECLLPAPAAGFKSWRDVALWDWKNDLARRVSRWRLSRIGFSSVLAAPLPDGLAAGINADALDALCSQEDPYSLLLGLELTAARLPTDEHAAERGKKLLERLLVEGDESERRNDLFQSAVILAYWGLQASVKWRKTPMYWRRMAVLAHAGVLTNALFRLTDPQAFHKWVTREGGGIYYFEIVSERREAPRWGLNRHGAPTMRGVLFKRARSIVMAVPEDRRPPEWLSIIESATSRLKQTGEIALAMLAGPLGDFEGYDPPFARQDFRSTIEELRNGVKPGELHGLELFVNGAPLLPEDLAIMVAYVKGFAMLPEAHHAEMVSVMTIMADAAAIYRNTDLAHAIGEQAVALFPKVDEALQRQLLGVLLDAGNAYSADNPGLSWTARAFEKLAWGATSVHQLENIADVIEMLRALKPATQPYFAATEATVRMREPHLSKRGTRVRG